LIRAQMAENFTIRLDRDSSLTKCSPLKIEQKKGLYRALTTNPLFKNLRS
jgi:hypothetical protein